MCAAVYLDHARALVRSRSPWQSLAGGRYNLAPCYKILQTLFLVGVYPKRPVRARVRASAMLCWP